MNSIADSSVNIQTSSAVRSLDRRPGSEKSHSWFSIFGSRASSSHQQSRCALPAAASDATR